MKNIIVEKRNRIGIVTVNRPNELNSMNSETRKELAIAFEELDLYKDKVKMLGVTYLTSWSGSDLLEIMNWLPGGNKVMWRENIDRIRPYGFAGMICSAKDIETVKPLAPQMIRVCPGIGKNKGQVRTVSAKQAIEMGADYIVVGRAITNANDPVQAVEEMKESINS